MGRLVMPRTKQLSSIKVNNEYIAQAGDGVNKLCGRCKIIKPLFDFGISPAKKIYRSWCFICEREYSKKWNKDNKDRHDNNVNNWISNNKDRRHKTTKVAYFKRLKCNFSVTQLESMLDSQKNRCKICDDLFINNKYCVDHDHNTLKIRGLLCNKCNLGLGLIKDNIDVLRNLKEYLLLNE